MYKQDWHTGFWETRSSNNPLIQGQVLVLNTLVLGHVKQYVFVCEQVKQVYEHSWHS